MLCSTQQNRCVVPIPDFDAETGNLPSGIHETTWDEIVAALATNPRRVDLADGLRRALDALRAAGCKRVFVDGSFVTAKEHPGDFDACWDARGVDPRALDPVLLDFTQQRAAQKAKFGGELFIANTAATPAGTVFLDFFQIDKATGDSKGIIAINLGGLP
jgi:hypothetical protein